MYFEPQTELENYEALLIEHLEAMLRALRKMSAEHWDWSPHPAAPSARIIGVHTWQWLVCDRQHITEPDVLGHALVPDAPRDIHQFCDVFEQEILNWRHLLRSLEPSDLLKSRPQFGNPDDTQNIRAYIGHMVQNGIYKHGQLAELFYALQYDGSGPYAAPFPNPLYEEMRKTAGLLE